MGMIMNKSGKFKENHPKAYKVIRVITILLFCLSFFFVGLFLGLTVQVAGDYKDGYVSGRIDRLFNPPIDTPTTSNLIPSDSSNKRLLEYDTRIDLSFADLSDSEYICLAFSSLYLPVGTGSNEYYDYLSMYGVADYSSFSQFEYYTAYLSAFPDELCHYYNTSSDFTYSSSVGNFMENFSMNVLCYTKSDLVHVGGISHVSDFAQLYYNLDDSEEWHDFASMFEVSSLTTYSPLFANVESPSRASYFAPPSYTLSQIQFNPTFVNSKWVYMPVLFIRLNPIEDYDFVSTYSSYLIKSALYQRGYDAGYRVGYQVGYQAGYSAGNTSLSIDWLLGFSNSFLSMPIFGGITLGNFLMVGIMLASFGGLLKLFFGG